MKKVFLTGIVSFFLFSVSVPAYASDWDKAGIALTGIEGLRILTGGRVDLVGSLFGLNRGQEYVRQPARRGRKPVVKKHSCAQRVWVPHYTWRKKYIPRHEKFDPQMGTIIVEGHYIQYRFEEGGHWEERYYCS